VKFHVILRRDLENARRPFRVVQHNGCEVEWVNVLLDQQRIRGVAETTLRSYAYDLLHFLRWWAKVKHSTAATDKALTESTLLDYIRFQTNQQPPPAAASINRRVGIAERALQLAFPQVQTPFVRGFQSGYWRPLPLGTGSPRPALSRLRVRTPKRVIVPLSDGEVAQFWASFRTTRDLAIVGLMLLDGLRGCEVLALNREDLLLSESQMRVQGKGNKLRWLPLAPETIQRLDHYLRWERPSNCGSPLFIVLKGRARGQRMTAAGLRSLFRHPRRTTDLSKANPHRFRHTFARDMLCNGVSLPALMQLMGHSKIQTTMVYVQLTAEEVYRQYAHAVAQLTQCVPSVPS
jgi:site-specific recombinase XerD